MVVASIYTDMMNGGQGLSSREWNVASVKSGQQVLSYTVYLVMS